MEQAFQYVDRMFDRFVDELSELCTVRSVKGDAEGLSQARGILTDRLKKLGISPKEYGERAETPFLYGRRAVPGKPTILFYNHYDVVAEGPLADWRTPPFLPTIRDGRLYGRGVSDNKGALLTRLQAVEAILEADGTLPAGIAYLLDGDEETGSETLSHMARNEASQLRQLTDADLCIWENGRTLPDGSPEVAFGVRSTLTVDLTVRSSNGDEHARMGAEIPNAAWRLAWALASLKSEDEHVRIDGFYDDVSPVTDADLRVLTGYPYDEAGMLARKEIPAFLLGLSGLELKKKIFMEPSLNICALEAGEPWKGIRNIVPHEASARLSFIMVPHQRAEHVMEKLERYLRKQGFEDVKLRAIATGFPVRTSVDHPCRDLLARASAVVYDRPLTPSVTQLGSGPAYLLRSVRPDLPIVCACGVAAIDSGHHSAKENIRLENYKNGIKQTIAALYEAGNLYAEPFIGRKSAP